MNNTSLPNNEMLVRDIKKYNFYQLVEVLHKEFDIDPELKSLDTDCRLTFSANPSLGFSASDVAKMTLIGDGKAEVQTNFFGITGAQSPLPSYILEQLVSDDAEVKRKFLDFFNNRLISLVYQSWRKYRYYVRFQEEAKDKFSNQLFSLVGLADDDLRGDTPINWCKMLAYSGTLAGKSRSPQVVSGIISHCFDLEEVSIKQWVKRKVLIKENQQVRLGMKNSTIGQDVVVGNYVNDIKGKFILQLKGLSRDQFLDFLPSGKEFLPLCKLVEFILREQMAYDLELVLNESQTPKTSLGNGDFSLGWSSFLGDSKSERKVLIQVRN
ncbi:type VI secretion protein, VC_A0111 family [Marinomonas posidonica IVIA-Po-181]|uniref:Type VI secretion protein, VC_A0111 family n=2 Tax=Marinomonas TaxID=28253 RepID=F6CWW0_MARPP|nr:type VI secretion protein, VC_A0111 family [Marinomonas posidonica IVIA-Po-181]